MVHFKYGLGNQEEWIFQVYISSPKSIQSDFSGFLGLSIPISIKEWPESLSIELIDRATGFKCERVNISLPDGYPRKENYHQN